MRKYSTEQRKILLAFFEENPDRQFAIEDIAEQLCEKANISPSSIYRNINDMVKDGSVARFPAQKSQQFLYQYIGGDACKSHIHMKCESCGQLFHLDDDSMQGILSSVKNTKGFSIDLKKTILYGSCENCD